jgi:hypothetical protein
LIDWNKARKALRAWLPTDDVVRVLDWAARKRLESSGLPSNSAEMSLSVGRSQCRGEPHWICERLDSVLGREAAIGFLKSVLRISTEALVEAFSSLRARSR